MAHFANHSETSAILSLAIRLNRYSINVFAKDEDLFLINILLGISL